MHESIEAYLTRFQSLKKLPGPTLTEEQAIRWLLDEMYLAAREMIRTHHKEDITRFIVLAQTLEGHGYTILWYKHRHCVGARRQNDDKQGINAEANRAV